MIYGLRYCSLSVVTPPFIYPLHRVADPDPVFSVAGFALFESPEMMPFFFKPLDPLCAFETTAAKAVPFGAYGVENALFWSRRHAHLIYQALEFAIIRANGGTEKKLIWS